MGVTMPAMGLMKKETELEAPNAIWEHIEAKDWEEISKDLGVKDAASMAKIWHKSYLPLHAVCKNPEAPGQVVVKLVDVYPEAAMERGKNRMLPLQVAVHHKCSYAVIRKLIMTYPDALNARVDDKNPIRIETTRTWIDLQSHQPDVKKLLQRSTDDWRVVIDYENEQREDHDKLISLERRLKMAKRMHDAADETTKSLDQRVTEIETAYEESKIIINGVIEEKERIVCTGVEELKKKLEAFMEMQKALNKEIESDIVAAKHREVAAREVVDVKKEELIGLFQQNLQITEELRKELSGLKLKDVCVGVEQQL